MEQDNDWGANDAVVEADWGADDAVVGGKKAPEQPTQNPGLLRGIADTGIALGQGIIGAGKTLTDLAGADNAVSRTLDAASNSAEEFKSQESQAARKYHQQQIQKAEASGNTMDEIGAYVDMVWDMPAESIAQGVGSFATLGVGKVAQAFKIAQMAKKAGMSRKAFMASDLGKDALKQAAELGYKTNIGVGTAQGMGTVKGAQYDQTYNAAKAKGLSEEEALALASDAQSYGEGWQQQLLGGALGYVAGKTGPIEKLAVGKSVGATSRARAAAGGFGAETLTEGAQGGQERYAGNTAAIDAKVLDPSNRFTGVAGSTVSEGMVGGLLGGGAGLTGSIGHDQVAVKIKEQIAKGNSPLSRAADTLQPNPVVNPVIAPVSDAITQAGQRWQAMAPDPQDDLARQQRIYAAAQGATFDGLPAGESEALPDPVSPDFIDGVPNGAVNSYAPGNSTGTGLPTTNAPAVMGTGPGVLGQPGAQSSGAPVDDLVPAFGMPYASANQELGRAPGDLPELPLIGDKINNKWTEFHPASGTLNIPRNEMPQIKSEHRGAMTNFLTARGITATPETVEASSLKPTQREFSPAKVKQALDFKGNDRPILVSSDGFILDGHHQWLAKAQQEVPVKITRLSKPIAELLATMKEFPSAGMTKDAEPFTQPQPNEKPTQAKSQQAQQQEAPAGPVKLVAAPQNVVVEPVSASNPGNALVRRRRAQVQRMAQAGFTRIETRGGQVLMVNPDRNEAMAVAGGPVAVTLAQQAIAALPKVTDNVALRQTHGLLPTGTTKDIGATQGTTVTGVGSPDRGGQEDSRIRDQPGTRVWDPETESFNALGAALQNATRDAADVAVTGPRIGSSAVARAPENDIRTKDLNKYLNVFGGFLGRRGIAISDPRSSGADDGLNDPATGRYYVNIDNAQMAPSRTMVHEASHNMEDLPEVWATYHKMWKLVPASVRKAYFEGYMEPKTSFDATRAQAARGDIAARNLMDKLKREMMADFMSGNFHDKLWLETMAKRKPHLFQQFIEEWIPLLGDMVDLVTDAVRKIEARRGTPSSLRLKDIDALMALHGAQKNLQAMKELAMDVAEAWATNNPGLAAKSNVNGVVQYAKRAGPDQWRPRDNFLVPEIDGFNSNTGNIMTLPQFQVTNKDGRQLSYPNMPVRISIGQHNVAAQDQFGAQHRIDNALEKPMERGYKTPYLGGGDAAKVERAVRDIAASIMGASLIYPDKKSPEFVVLYDNVHATVLQRTTDKQGQDYWSVKSVIPKKSGQMRYEYGNPAPIKGPRLDGVEPQQFNAIQRGILNMLRGPGIDLSASEAYILSDIGLIVSPTANIDVAKTTDVKPRTPKEIAEARARMRAKLFKKADGEEIQKSERVALKDDLAEQEKWLDYEAKSHGYADVEDLFIRNGDLFNELARLWREQRPVEALYSKRDELQAELDAEMNGVALDVSMAEVKTKGIMAESAYPALAWRVSKGSAGTQYVADIEGLRANGRTERLEMNEDSRSGLWDLSFPGTWVGPSMGESDGYASKKAVQAFAQRQAAARDLKLQGFDLASTLTKAQQFDLLSAWRTMERAPTEGAINGAHKYAGIKAVSQSLKEIAADMGITRDYDLTVARDLQDQNTSSFNLTFRHKVSGAEFGARLDQHQAEGKKFLTANTLEMGKGGLGAALYQMAAEYAARRNMPLRPESSLSGINSYRRTEQQLSAALRTGKSNAMVPHLVQRVYGFEDNASRKESHDANLVRLILAGLRNARELVNDFDKLRYVPETGEFTDAKGNSKEAAVQKLLASPDARAFGLGRSTLARALLSKQVLDGAKAPQSFKEPILYSTRDTAALEYQAVIDQYQGTDAWMKAPNGQPTNLTERQWVQVRTPSFASWFGPWQEYGPNTDKGTVWNDSEGKVSKAIDENGEPLVVYHGTDNGGFMAFSQPGGEKRGDLGIFTTPNRNMASSYIRKGRAQDMTPLTDDEVLKEIGIEVAPYQGRTSSRDTEDRTLYGYTTPDGDEVSFFLTREEAVKSAIDDFGDVEFEKKSGIYAVFMNIRNPNEDDFEGALWSGSREHLWQVVDADGNTLESNGKIYMEEDEARALANSIAEPDDEYKGADYMHPADDHWNDTDGMVRDAIRMKNDGAIVRNVVDDGGGYSSYNNEPSDVFVALEPEQLKSADFNTGEFGLSRDLRHSKRDTDFTDPELRLTVSTAQPRAMPDRQTGYQPSSYTEKRVIDTKDITGSKTHLAKVVAAVRQYNTMSGQGDESAVLAELHKTVVANLLWLHDRVLPGVRERAKLWYDGANRIANDWETKFGLATKRQAGGILAVFSPQKDWFSNVSLAERALTILTRHKDETWSPGMTNWAHSWLNASSSVAEKHSRQAHVKKMMHLADSGKTLDQITPKEAAYFVRAFDEAYYPRAFRLVTPEGGFDDFVRGYDGTLDDVNWGGFDTIEKAVNIFRDGSHRNLDQQLGAEHKVRNFYNNIVEPGSADGHVTIDTHAIAAALLKAASGNSLEVLHNFGSTPKGVEGAGSSAHTGASGSYALFADAYRDAAAKRGLLAREMQSITWEAVRALFPSNIKGQMVRKVDAIHNQVKAGKLSQDQARAKIEKLSVDMGGSQPFAWQGRGHGTTVADGATSFDSSLAENPLERVGRTNKPKDVRDKMSVSISASTNAIPGIKRLYTAAQKGNELAHAQLQEEAFNGLKEVLKGTSAAIKFDPVTGLYGGYSEPSLAVTVSFKEKDRNIVLAALKQFADNYKQEQIHVRQSTKAKAGTKFADGSYATSVYKWDLKRAMERSEIQAVIDQSGLYGLTFGEDFIEAYYVGDFNEQDFQQFRRNIASASSLVGGATASSRRSVARLWPYGRGDGGIGWGGVDRNDTAGQQVQRSAREGGPGSRRRPSDAATVRQAIHFGQRAGLSQLSGLSNGTGIRGAEDQRLKEATDLRIKRRVYFYSPVSGGIPQPEVGLGGNVYQTDLENLYNPSTATRPLSGSGNTFESSVLDAGYDGYLDPMSGVIVVLGRDVPAKQIGNISDFNLIQRVAKRVVMPTRTTVSGDELVRKPEPAELMALVKNRDILLKAAPSFRMEYGFARVSQAQAADFDQAMAALGSSFRLAENTAPVATQNSLPNSKIEVNKTLSQRADTMRKLIACLA